MKDIVKECVWCGKEFVVTGDQQQFFLARKLEIPKRCEECRKKKREMIKAREAKEDGYGK